MQQIILYNQKVIQQTLSMLKALTTAQYQAEIPLLFGSTIGKHTRHIIEFYTCFFASLSTGKLSYDARERNPRLETDLAFAGEVLTLLYNTLSGGVNDLQLEMSATLFEGNPPHISITTSRRELNYLADHTVHHLALMKVGVAVLDEELKLSSEIGIAASTLLNEAKKN